MRADSGLFIMFLIRSQIRKTNKPKYKIDIILKSIMGPNP